MAGRACGAAISACVLLAAGPSWSRKSFDISPPVAVTPLPDGTATHAAVLTRVVFDIPRGQQIGFIMTDLLGCAGDQPLPWTGATGQFQADAGLRRLFNYELARGRFRTAGDPGSLFESDPSASDADLEVGVEIKSVHEDICNLIEESQIIGLTVAGYEPNGAPAGLNLFIPIRDAMDFLALSIGAGAG